jgi:hypothetical protein
MDGLDGNTCYDRHERVRAYTAIMGCRVQSVHPSTLPAVRLETQRVNRVAELLLLPPHHLLRSRCASPPSVSRFSSALKP